MPERHYRSRPLARRYQAPRLYADGDLWERDLEATLHMETLSLTRWVERHTERGSQLELFGEEGD
mgnify:CR=1 FL=1